MQVHQKLKIVTTLVWYLRAYRGDVDGLRDGGQICLTATTHARRQGGAACAEAQQQ
jgi:hypothetical protein